MDVKERAAGDIERLEALIRAEARARQRDRYRMALLALRGGEKLEIAAALGVAKSTVEEWVYRYRDGGIERLTPRKAKGMTPTLARERHEAFKKRIADGPRANDGVCAFRGKDAVRILHEEYQADYSLNGAYLLLHRLGLTRLTPRPRHEKNDPEAVRAFKESAPLLSGA